MRFFADSLSKLEKTTVENDLFIFVCGQTFPVIKTMRPRKPHVMFISGDLVRGGRDHHQGPCVSSWFFRSKQLLSFTTTPLVQTHGLLIVKLKGKMNVAFLFLTNHYKNTFLLNVELGGLRFPTKKHMSTPTKGIHPIMEHSFRGKLLGTSLHVFL